MKKNILFFALMALMAAGCAKTATTGPNDSSIRYFHAWQKVFYPNADSTALGVYILENENGSGKEVKANGYALVEFVVTDLEGNISSYTNKEIAEQLGAYSEIFYYGPKIINTAEGKIQAGIADFLIGMKSGGRIKAAIPGWLMTTTVFESKEEYMQTESSSEDYIYDLKVIDFIEDINKWQTDSIGTYFKNHSDIFGDMTVKDTLKGYSGMYYKQLKQPTDTTSFPKDTSIYINYTGKLLNGKVFDTSIERVAKDNGLYSSSKEYAPVKITWGDNHSELKMGTSGSSVINGFSLTLWQMRAMEKGIGIFISDYGYGATGSGQTIPPYSPLVFEIEIVEKPE